MSNNFNEIYILEIIDDKISVEEMKNVWRKLLWDKVGLICFMENPEPNGKPIIAGVNMTFVSQKGKESIPEVRKKHHFKSHS